MNQEHDEQTRWLVEYLETRFNRAEDRMLAISSSLESRLDASLQRAEAKLSQALDRQAEDLERTEARLDELEASTVRLNSQAGFIKNILAFVGTLVLSLLGWAASYLSPFGK